MAVDFNAQLALGARALSAHRRAAATASHNLQNASTPGFARQRTDLTANAALAVPSTGFSGTGVVVSQVSQARDRFVEARMPVLIGNAAASEAQTSILESITAFDPEGGQRLAEHTARFFGALRGLANRPGDASARRAAVGTAENFAFAVQNTAADLDRAIEGITSSLQATTAEASRLAQNVADLNRRVRVAAAEGGGLPNDLLDERQRSVDELARLTGARVVPGDDDDVLLVLPGGQPLVVGDNAARLDIGPGNPLAVRVTGTDGTAPQDLRTEELSGVIGGALRARDQVQQDLADLDQLVFDVGTAINAAHAAGFAQDGSSGGALFDLPAGATGAARSFAVNAAVRADPALLALSKDATRPNDGGNIAVFLNVEASTAFNGDTPAGALSTLAAQMGEQLRSATLTRDTDRAVLDHGVALRESISGVSIDEELVELQRAERAFQAASKVITTVDQMLETVLNLKQ